MKEPPQASPQIMDTICHCLWSQACAETMHPGYRCQYQWKQKNKYCHLYLSGSCSKYEVFPESCDG